MPDYVRLSFSIFLSIRISLSFDVFTASMPFIFVMPVEPSSRHFDGWLILVFLRFRLRADFR